MSPPLMIGPRALAPLSTTAWNVNDTTFPGGFPGREAIVHPRPDPESGVESSFVSPPVILEAT